MDVDDLFNIESDLRAVYGGVVYLEMTSATTAAAVFLTMLQVPKTWHGSMLCADFHMRALSFAIPMATSSAEGLQALRAHFTKRGVEVRDTKMKRERGKHLYGG